MSPLLEAEGVEAGYGADRVLHGLSLAIGRGEVATLIGRNGMGKSTFVKVLMGQLKLGAGAIRLDGTDIGRLADYRIAQSGLALVPEGRAIFSNLNVRENLLAGRSARNGGAQPWSLETVYAMFPRLKERERQSGVNLSGGEQQMLAIGRALMTNPRLLILDEATEGLAPLVRQDIWRCLQALKATGMSMLVIDKNLGALARFADRHYAIEKGRIVWQGTSDELRRNKEKVLGYVTV